MEIFQNPNVPDLVDIVFSQDSDRNSSSEERAIDTLDPLGPDGPTLGQAIITDSEHRRRQELALL